MHAAPPTSPTVSADVPHMYTRGEFDDKAQTARMVIAALNLPSAIVFLFVWATVMSLLFGWQQTPNGQLQLTGWQEAVMLVSFFGGGMLLWYIENRLIFNRMLRCPICDGSLRSCCTWWSKRPRLRDHVTGCPSCRTKFIKPYPPTGRVAWETSPRRGAGM